MCGIAGFELRGHDDETAARLLHRLIRRGPDANWFTRAGPYGFVQSRLAVIDLSERVRYPLRSESGVLQLLFNGEIYDHETLRGELQRRGHSFGTACDAEVLLHGYEEWGGEVFRRLDGMFAAALFDSRSGDLVLVRDALGIKPLVYVARDRFAFSSETVALVTAGLSDGKIDDDSLGDYLAFHCVPPTATGVAGVTQLGPGEALTRSADGRTVVDRWRAKPFSRPPDPWPVELEEVGAALDRSVRRQLVADVPVGVMLSSGLDSSLILESAVRNGARPRAFTIGFPGHGDYDEVPSASRLARELDVPHVVGEVSGGFADVVDSVCDAFDQPFADASAIATLQLARLTRDGVTVALTGTGGDDLFAGYYRHRAHLLERLIGGIPRPARRLLAAVGTRRGDERRSMFSLARAYAARLAAIEDRNPYARYIALVTSVSSERAADVMHRAAPLERARQAARRRLHEASTTTDSVLRAIQAFELETYLAGDLLTKEDRTTMAVGLEARVPLLGNELLELANRAHDQQKIGLRSGKRLLRDLARSRLPAYVARTRKRGFAVPLVDLFAGPWHRDAIDWFSGSPSQLVDGSRAAQLLKSGELPATDAWALAVIVGFERLLSEARRKSRSELLNSEAIP